MNVTHENSDNSKDEWLTPPSLIKSLGEFDLDPCAPIKRPWDMAKNHFTTLDNGLMKDWFGRVWCNPPYSNQSVFWLNKLALHGNGIALLFARTETVVYQDVIFQHAHSILFMRGRIHFYTVEGKLGTNGSGAGSCLISYGENNTQAVIDSKIKGKLFLI